MDLNADFIFFLYKIKDLAFFKQFLDLFIYDLDSRDKWDAYDSQRKSYKAALSLLENMDNPVFIINRNKQILYQNQIAKLSHEAKNRRIPNKDFRKIFKTSSFKTQQNQFVSFYPPSTSPLSHD